ncbi:MAG: DUF4349 domain-containing protein [Betaproteobacteria bacterium]|nr:DUF4349 domain-containing protein [Betaproteobacteria bacterium]
MKNILVLVSMVALLVACGSEPDATRSTPKSRARAALAPSAYGGLADKVAETPAPIAQVKNERNKFLAFEHDLTIETDDTRLKPLYDELLANCRKDEANSCVVLDAGLSSDRVPYGHIRIRAKADGINALAGRASQAGRVLHQETRAEDLAGPIVDTGRRLEMLNLYQKKLMELERKAGYDIENLIKISKELASVQAEIEQATGEQSRLAKRVATDILNITLNARISRSYWAPIQDALAGLADSLPRGIAAVIHALPYVLPWLAILLMVFAARKKLLKLGAGSPRPTQEQIESGSNGSK